MNKGFRRTVIFLISMVLMSMSASLSTKASLGVSPISSVPYTLSLIPDTLTFGMWTFIFNLALVFGGIAIMRRNYKPFYALCVAFVIVFSYLCDVFLMVFEGIHPDNYILQWVVEAISIILLAFGISLSVASSISMLPGDFFVRFLSVTRDWNFGHTKIAFDFTCIVTSVIISLLFLPEISGIREGTIVFIIAVGPLINLFTHIMRSTGFLHWAGYEPIEIKKDPTLPSSD